MNERWEPDHPLRPPNWRWCRANEAVRVGGNLPRSDANDSEVIKAAAFCRQLENNSLEKTRAVYKHEYLAWRVYSDEDYQQLKWEIEARLIAGQPNEEIGVRVSIYPDVLEKYERWFCNVRDRLQNTGYLYNQLVAPLIPKTPKDTDYEMLWKFYALKGDGLILDSLIYGFCEKATTTGLSGVQAFWAEDYQETIGRKGAVAAKLVKVDFNTFLNLLDHRIKLLDSDRAAGRASGSTQDSILYNIQVALSQVPWLESGVQATQLGNASYRANELLEGVNKQPDPNFVKMLESASYPVDE